VKSSLENLSFFEDCEKKKTTFPPPTSLFLFLFFYSAMKLKITFFPF